MIINTDIIGQAYQGRDRSIDTEKCVNLFPEINSQNSKNVASLISTPGSRRAVTLSGKLRGGIQFRSQLWVVADDGLYRISSYGNTLMGKLSTKVGNIEMAQNGSQILIVDGSYMYVFNTKGNNNNLTLMNSANVPPNPTQCDYIDGFFVVNENNTGRFWLSEYNDGLTWNGLRFATAEGSPDNLLSIKVFGRNIWLFGDKTTEIWYNNGNKDFSFQRIAGAYVEAGILAPYSVASTDKYITWLSRMERGDGAIYSSQNGNLVRISTPEIESIMNCAITTDATAFTYYDIGHTFYCITFPSLERTFVFDFSTKMWHERSTNGNRWIGSNSVTVNGQLYALDYNSGRILFIDNEIYTDDGSPIVRTRTSKHNHNNRRYIEVNSLEIEVNKMQNTNLVEDPKVSLSVSRDGGYTFSKEMEKGVGLVGKYKNRIKFNRLGTGRDFIFTIKMSDPVKWILVDAISDIEVIPE